MLTIKIRDVANYMTRDGRCPFDNWLNKFRSNVVKARILSRVERAGEGNFGSYRNLGEIYELKENLGPGYRIYFGIQKDTVIILLVGGDKSTQTQDIERAKIYWNDFKDRNKSK